MGIRRNFSKQNVDILLILFRLLTLQCILDVQITLYYFYTTKKMSHESIRSIWILLKSYSSEGVYRPVTSLGHQGGRRVFWEWPKLFKLCPILLNNVQNIFPGGREFFLGEFAPLVTGLGVYEFATKLYFLSTVTAFAELAVTVVNSIQLSLNWTWTIKIYVCVSLIWLCWLNITHFSNLLSELCSTLRLSEMLFFTNCLISSFASTFYK